MAFPPQLDVPSGEIRSSVYKRYEHMNSTYYGRTPAGGLGLRWSSSLGFAEQAANRVAGLRALAQPVLHSLRLEIHKRGLLLGVIRADDLDKTAVARTRLLRHHHP